MYEKSGFLPACLRVRAAQDCRATAAGPGFTCAACTPECQIARIAKLGKEHHFKVLIIPHESSLALSGPADRWRDTGVIGVSCVLNLIEGGMMLQDKGIPAQCVILDFCGCKNHWHDRGIPTQINEERLLTLLDSEHNSEYS